MFIGYDPGTCMTLTYFTARSTWVAYVFELGKLIKCHLKVKTCRKWANGLNMYDSENIWTPGVSLPPPWGNIPVCYKNIQISPFLKPLGQSKPNFT